MTPAVPCEPRSLRTILCTRGGLFGALVFKTLSACDHIELCGIVRSSRWFHPALGVLGGSRAYIRRSGLSYSMYLLCATALGDALRGLGKGGRVPLRTRPGGIPVHTTPDINGTRGSNRGRVRSDGCPTNCFMSSNSGIRTFSIVCVVRNPS